jgi:PAS domain S-box-containing protein
MAGPLIQVVDDDTDTRELYHLIFEMEGYRVNGSSTVQNALDSSASQRPDVVLTDWHLSDGTGLSLCEAYSRNPGMRHIPRVMVTGRSLNADQTSRAKAAGCERILLKPVAPNVLVTTVARALEVQTSRRLRAVAVSVRRYAQRIRASSNSQAAQSALLREAIDRSAGRRSGNVAIVVADDNGHYVAANKGASELTGYGPQELTSLSVWDLTPQPEAVEGLKLWTQFIVSGTQEGRYVVRHRNGQPVEARYVAIANVVPGLHVSALATTLPMRQELR